MSSTTAGKTAITHNNDVDAYETVADDSPPRTTNGDYTKTPRMGAAPDYNPATRPKGLIVSGLLAQLTLSRFLVSLTLLKFVCSLLSTTLNSDGSTVAQARVSSSSCVLLFFHRAHLVLRCANHRMQPSYAQDLGSSSVTHGV
jgi:hypothetical protein